jgi:hypothetical protein
MAACSVCGREPVEARGLCHACYQKWRHGAPFDAPLTRSPKGKYRMCTLPACGRAHYAKTLCRLHYQRQLAGHPPEGRPVRGENHGKSKLTERSVRDIRGLRAQGWSCARLATRFAVSDDAVRSVISRRTWGHL